ncbi:258_t:CDS:2, partial [Funneliformis caledonium]
KELETHLKRYALQEEFSYKKTRVDYHLSQDKMKGLTAEQKKHEIKRRTYEFIVTRPKKENPIGITSIKLEYNHEMNPLVNEMALKFWKFTQPMLNDVEFYVKHETTNDVPSKFFGHINKICKEFLTPHILAVTQNQMNHLFFYDAYLMDRNFIQQSMIRNIQNVTIIEIWEIKLELSQTKSHFVILMIDGNHFCTCNFLISFGVPCRHFYKVLRKSPEAKFHISLINQRWYYDLKLSITDEELALLNVILIVEDSSEATVYREMNFNYIHQVRDGQVYTEKLQKIVSAKVKYGRSLRIARKALDLAQKLNYYNELNEILQTEEETANQNKKQKVTNLELEHTIENEVNDGDNKKQRRCKGCKGIGHDLRNCKSKPLSERN